MALTNLQRRVCNLVADRRRETGESYVAGGVALSEATASSRISRDLDLFHDSRDAVAVSAQEDQALLGHAGLIVEVLRDLPGFVEALARDDRGDAVLIQWVADSAFRFFPLVPDDELGLTLHPLDLATNKVCALVGRVEVRDWIDTLVCHERLQPLGYLAWAACGKDTGLNPSFILAEAARTARYSPVEVENLTFDGPPPNFVERSEVWRAALAEAHQIVRLLPPEHVGEAVLNPNGDAFRGSTDDLRRALQVSEVAFHSGAIRGVFPVVRPCPADA